MPLSLQARWLITSAASEPLADGVLTVEGSHVRSTGEPSPEVHERIDLGNVALLPGFINAHTHLEFGSMVEPLAVHGTFADWIREVIGWRRGEARAGADPAKAIQEGIEESLAGGVTTIGEISTVDLAEHPLREHRAAAVIFRELLGLTGSRAADQAEVAERFLEGFDKSLGDTGCGPGLSPHAPYTVSPQLVKTACQLSNTRRIPLAMHLAESLDELELLQSHSGPLVELLRELEAWDSSAVPRGIRPMDYLTMLAESERALIVHGNFLGRNEMQYIGAQQRRLSVVYCPRTFAHFGHGRYPLDEMFEAGVRVVLGTDSRASNPDLSMLEEMRFVREQHDVSARRLIQMVTQDAAAAMGLSGTSGSLEPGRRADWLVVRLPEHDGRDPWELILDPASAVVATVVAGNLVWGDWDAAPWS